MSRLIEDRQVIRDNQHDFPKGKFCPTSLVVFHDGMTREHQQTREELLIKSTWNSVRSLILSHTIFYSREIWAWWMEKKLSRWKCPKNCGQCPDAQLKISKNQCPSSVHTETILFNTINYIDSGADNNFAGDTKLSGKVYVLEGRDATQRKFCRLEDQAHTNFIKFNKANV